MTINKIQRNYIYTYHIESQRLSEIAAENKQSQDDIPISSEFGTKYSIFGAVQPTSDKLEGDPNLIVTNTSILAENNFVIESDKPKKASTKKKKYIYPRKV